MASGSEDELSSPPFNRGAAGKLSSDLDDLDDLQNTTPIDNLRRLAAASQQALRDARTPSSPARPPSSIPSSIGSRLADRTNTSLQNARNPSRPFGRRPMVRGTQPSGGMPTTPHAIRAMEERRRVVMTPSRERRRASGRGLERGSPFDILRALSQVATVPAPVQETIPEDEEEEELASDSAEESPPSINDSDSSDEVAKPPRISLSANEMRLEDDDDDTGVLRPPEMSRLEDDEDLTVQSIEAGRRAAVDTSFLRRNRNSDFFGPSGLGIVPEDDSLPKQPASPSFMLRDQSLFPGLGADDGTINLVNTDLARNAAPAEDIDFADSTFNFDIPQDTTLEALEDDDDDDEAEDERTSNLNNAAADDDDDEDGPEGFGSQADSELENVNAEDLIPDDTDANQFFDGGGDNVYQDDEDLVVNDQEEEPVEIAQQEISRRLEDEYGANEAIARPQLRPVILTRPSIIPDKSDVADKTHSADESLVPDPVPVRVVPRPVPKPAPRTTSRAPRAAKPVITSKHGQKVPSLPANVVKAIADSFLPHSGKTSKKTKKDTLAALMQATDWFFEQVSEDLDAYSKHADRDTIEEADVVALMRRQRVLAAGAKNVQGNRSAAPGSSKATLFSLAQRFLPRELITELRMEPPSDERRKKRRKIDEGGEYE